MGDFARARRAAWRTPARGRRRTVARSGKAVEMAGAGGSREPVTVQGHADGACSSCVITRLLSLPERVESGGTGPAEVIHLCFRPVFFLYIGPWCCCCEAHAGSAANGHPAR